jgi:hypothetical protein
MLGLFLLRRGRCVCVDVVDLAKAAMYEGACAADSLEFLRAMRRVGAAGQRKGDRLT